MYECDSGYLHLNQRFYFVCEPIPKFIRHRLDVFYTLRVLVRNVWIGSNSTILPGVTVGDNAVIGARSVVTKDIPENMIAVGSPARVIRSIFDR